MTLHWLSKDSPPDSFPDVSLALDEPAGLLAAGGDLEPQRLIAAYRRGIFPWYEAGQPILWWSPDPRAVLFPEEFHVSRSLHRTLRRELFTTTVDTDFAAVIGQCARERPGQRGTWITTEMKQAYLAMHRLGLAHSVEVWHREQLVGGVYGLSLGRVFFGESMFSTMADASKVGLLSLARLLQAWNYPLIDCQISSPHLHTLGATLIPRRRFVALLDELCSQSPAAGSWGKTGPESVV
jgi:leucyl/phenylalanyl-tRNA--protein transferase